jgi:hypothetical protein
MFLTLNFFAPKFMKIRYSALFFWVFCKSLLNQLSTHNSNLNSMLVIMSEVKFFLLTGVLTQNLNTVGLVYFFEKIEKSQI